MSATAIKKDGLADAASGNAFKQSSRTDIDVPLSNGVRATPKSTSGIVDNLAQSSGVFRDNAEDDIQVLVNNFTAPALAEALRSRESVLQRVAALVHDSDSDPTAAERSQELKDMLVPFLQKNVEKRRIRKHTLDLSESLTKTETVIIQRYLHKMPRHVFHAADKRASVVIPLCNDNGVASILFQQRSSKMRHHPQQVCFPGGMLEEGVDTTIIQTSLRETEEELGIPREKIEVLGIMRCNWDEVASMTGVAVTPVVGFLGELNNLELNPNSDEVEEFFTVPLKALAAEENWMKSNFSSPVFIGGKHKIWGLTAYLLRKFMTDVVAKCATNSQRNEIPGTQH